MSFESPESLPVQPTMDHKPYIDADVFLHDLADRQNIQNMELDSGTIQAAFEESPEIRRYREDEPITIEVVEAVPKYVASHLQEIGVSAEEIQGVEQTIAGLIKSIINSIDNYSQRVRSFRIVEIQRFRLEPGEFRERLQRHDSDRRIAHETMIADFRAYNRYLSGQLYQKYSLDIPREFLFPEEFFPSQTNAIDRSHSQDWALTTDYFLRARHLIQMIEKERTHGEPAPAENF